MRKNIVLSAFACDPSKGSEPGYGWNWATELANNGYTVHCFTRIVGKDEIAKRSIPENLIFHYVSLPLGGEKLYSSSMAGMYLYYIIWQWIAYRKAKTLHRQLDFNLAHHVTWGSLQLGSFMYKLGIPFVFGPAGGGQVAPVAFKQYFLNYWSSEKKREKISSLMLRFNPACKMMLRKAYAVLVSNDDTRNMAIKAGASNVILTLDVALSKDFFPNNVVLKQVSTERLKLLWVGRFLPRKGILLLLDVMKELKAYPGITLTVVGDGEMKDVFLAKLNDYKLDGTVEWKGKVPFSSINEYYKNHDAFLFTSLRESGGVQLVEAMAFSLPVICLNLHGQAQIVNNTIGLLCACPDPETAIRELKKGILDFYNNRDLVIEKGQAAHDFAIQQTWDNKIREIVGFYPR